MRAAAEGSRRTQLFVATVVEALHYQERGAADRAVETLARGLGADSAVLGIVEDDTLVLRGAWNVLPVARGRPVRRGEAVLGRVWASGRPRLVPDLAAEPAYVRDAEHTRSAVYVPGLSRGRVLVVIGLASRRLRTYREDHVRMLTPVADLLAAAVDSARQLREAQLREEQLLVGVGTQLRGPLTGIVGNLGTLEQYGDRVPANIGDELLNAARRSTARISRLLDALTLAGRLGVGGVEVMLSAVPASAAVSAALGRLRDELVDVRVGVDASVESAPPLLADHDQLVTALTELLHNAVRHGGGSAVTVSADERDDGTGAIVVRDGGPGLAPGITDGGGRLGDVGASLARGLGLTLTSRLVDAMHGRLALRSRPGRGTTAEIVLPLAPR